MNGYNFTERGRKAIALAREVAVRMRQKYVDSDHLLLGLIREGEGVAVAVLEGMGVDSKSPHQSAPRNAPAATGLAFLVRQHGTRQ